MQLLSLTILLVFGFGTAALVSLVFSPHWLWLIPAYGLGSILGVAAIWLAYALPAGPSRRAASPKAGAAENRS